MRETPAFVCTLLAAALAVSLSACRTRLPTADGMQATEAGVAFPAPAEAPCDTPDAAAPEDAAPEAATPEGAANEGQSMHLARLIALAAERNPRLAAARARWKAARQRGTVARSLPDPLLTYTEMIEPIQTRVGPLERSLQFRQAIPFPGKLSAAGCIADERARVKEVEYHIALRDVVADVKVSYAELVYLHRAIHIVGQNQALAKLLAEKSAAGFATQGEPAEDTISLFDTLKAQQALAQLAYDKITLRELLSAEEAKLNALLSRPPGTPLGVPQELRFRPLSASQGDLFVIARERRQEIRGAIHKVRAANHAQRLARLSRVPDFAIGVQYSFIGDAAMPVRGSGDDGFGLQFGFSLPIWGNKNRARIEEARQLARAAKYEQQAVTDDVMARISKIYFRLQNAERLSRLYLESLIPQAERGLEIAEQWQATGRDTYGRLLEARGVWLNFQLAAQRARVDHEQMVARMEQLTGISLGHLRGEAVK